jgi:phage terminase Nu1 subunit (DNA packaging protein)
VPPKAVTHLKPFRGSTATTKELCECFDVSAQYLGKMQSDGQLPQSIGKSAWPAFEAVAAFVALLRARTARKEKNPESESGDYEFERTRKVKAEADIAEIEAALLNSKVLEAEAVRELWTDQLYSARNRILGIPSKIAARMPAEFASEALKIGTQEIHDALTEMSDYNPKDIAKRTDRKRLFKRSEQGDAAGLAATKGPVSK